MNLSENTELNNKKLFDDLSTQHQHQHQHQHQSHKKKHHNGRKLSKLSQKKTKKNKLSKHHDRIKKIIQNNNERNDERNDEHNDEHNDGHERSAGSKIIIVNKNDKKMIKQLIRKIEDIKTGNCNVNKKYSHIIPPLFSIYEMLLKFYKF